MPARLNLNAPPNTASSAALSYRCDPRASCRLLIAHLSDSHLRDASDVDWLARQLDRIAARNPQHLAITGDLLDRWNPRLLDRALAVLDAGGWLDRERLTLLHGNHDLASSGGYPQRRSDLWRLGTRFWDPPPLLAWRRRRFHARIDRDAAGVAPVAPFAKTLASGLRVAGLDTVPFFWRPVRVEGRTLAVQHGIGQLQAADAAWLRSLPAGQGPLILLVHHYPLRSDTYRWSPKRGPLRSAEFSVPMNIPATDRAALWDAAEHAGVRLVLCGHVHRARLEWERGIAVGLNGQSGAAWAGRTIAWYTLGARVEMELERAE